MKWLHSWCPVLVIAKCYFCFVASISLSCVEFTLRYSKGRKAKTNLFGFNC